MPPDLIPDHITIRDIIVMVSGGGFGAVALRILDSWLSRSKQKEDSVFRYNEILRSDLEKEKVRNAEVEIRYLARIKAQDIHINELERQIQAQFRANVALDTENKILRGRYHRIRNYITNVLIYVRKRLGVPDSEELVGIPNWVDEEVDGPTALSIYRTITAAVSSDVHAPLTDADRTHMEDSGHG